MTREHWNGVYNTKGAEDVSWFEPSPTQSLALIELAGMLKTTRIVDIGGGRSSLAAELRARGYTDVDVLDIAESVHPSIVADVTTWKPTRKYRLWHDRAVFHFLVDPAKRTAYRETLASALKPRGKAIIATFADDGPERCSGLPVMRYSPESLAAELAPVLTLVEARRHTHITPWGSEQRFVYGLFERRAQ